ncbi:hypothetical protein NFI96_006485 [Prochilodus magdalenae]|nr:hypothetical protein NFI96_006485 [Prochilodus magdalenae]
MQLEHPHTVPADGAVEVEAEDTRPSGRVACDALPRCLHTQIRWASPPRPKRDSSLKMTRCHSESLHDSLSCVVQPSADGVALTGGLMGDTTARWMSVRVVLGQSGLSLVVGLVLYISSINDEVMNRPREPEQFFNYHYGWSFAFAASSFLLKEYGKKGGEEKSKEYRIDSEAGAVCVNQQGAGVMSVYLFMKRYAEEEMYRPHPALYRPRLSDSSDYSGQFLHPESWPPPQRARSTSELSSDVSIQLAQNPQHLPKPGVQQGPPPNTMTTASSPTSTTVYQLQSPNATTTFTHNHPLRPTDPQGLAMPPPAVPPPHYHAHMRMSASPLMLMKMVMKMMMTDDDDDDGDDDGGDDDDD